MCPKHRLAMIKFIITCQHCDSVYSGDDFDNCHHCGGTIAREDVEVLDLAPKQTPPATYYGTPVVSTNVPWPVMYSTNEVFVR